MPYTNDPKQPKVRRDAVLFAEKHGVRCAARRYGVSPGTVSKWKQKAQKIGLHPIPTQSSRPKSHPRQLDERIVQRIVELRLAHGRTSEVVHQELLNEGLKVSLNSVRRTIDRHGLMKKRSPWKRYHPPVERPIPQKAGDLVQIDTVHLMTDKKKRIYVFALIDVYSRWVYARSFERMSAKTSVLFVEEAQQTARFRFNMMQSDHGPEFGKWFVERMQKTHRYTRVGKPNDNAHIERFNRTIQEECLDKVPRKVEVINRVLPKYLEYYNTKRLHLGISCKAPVQLL